MHYIDIDIWSEKLRVWQRGSRRRGSGCCRRRASHKQASILLRTKRVCCELHLCAANCCHRRSPNTQPTRSAAEAASAVRRRRRRRRRHRRPQQPDTRHSTHTATHTPCATCSHPRVCGSATARGTTTRRWRRKSSGRRRAHPQQSCG